MPMSIEYPQKMLEMCGISQPEIEEQIQILENHFDKNFMDAIFKRYNGLSVTLIQQICERAILAESLADNEGFRTIRKEIINPKNNRSSLDEPHGAWFQLIVGYLLKSIH